ncbi:helix-turn-helix domain-containing protein [Lentibacillus salinarum]|uniref:Helix-turn-helix domain-containing protein n=1 Tax=Lentibacillus salinarum TaxID=446820 RepID=A0ABW3ZWG6_9BACI
MKYEMVIETTEQLHALSHPLRQRILSLLSYQEMTNKSIAEELKETPAKVFFHVKQLLDAELIRMTKEEQNRNIVEKYYTSTARSFRLSPSFELTKTDEHMIFESTFHETYRNLIDSINFYNGSLSQAMVGNHIVDLTEEEIKMISHYLDEMNAIIETSKQREYSSETELKPFSFSYFFHPSVPRKSDGGDES